MFVVPSTSVYCNLPPRVWLFGPMLMLIGQGMYLTGSPHLVSLFFWVILLSPGKQEPCYCWLYHWSWIPCYGFYYFWNSLASMACVWYGCFSLVFHACLLWICDNKSAIQIAHNSVFYEQMKHIKMSTCQTCIHFVFLLGTFSPLSSLSLDLVASKGIGWWPQVALSYLPNNPAIRHWCRFATSIFKSLDG